MLLAVLAGALFALAGVPLRLRLLLTLALIALYVPVAGGGPSIQRAGIMAAAALVATLASRPADRLYALLTAAAGTLALNPLAAGDVGWQLSFAAVTGIMLVAAPLRERLLAGAIGRLPERLGRPLAEGTALTAAATLATAPLLAHHFETLSLASLPANLLALPLVAPIMWLGMLAALAGQLPVPVEPLGAVAGVLIGWLDGVARLMSAPGWAQVGVSLASPAAVVATYAALGAGLLAALAAHRRRDGLGAPRAVRVLGPLLLALVLLLVAGGEPGDGIADRRPGALRIVQLDVGQGDAILLDPPRGRPLLVDAGPPGGGLAEALGRHGAERLAAVVITHHQLDHDGALSEIAGSVPFGRLIVGPSRPPQAAAVAAESGASVLPVAAGSELRSGRLEIDVLWPPADAGPAAADPNAEALVLAVRFRGYSALLSADAEQELTHLDPGPLDVLKVAHHGSADAGLGALLDRSAPRVALIGVGENSYGHPTAETLETLAERGVCILRTDLDGDVWAEIGPGGVSIGAQSGGVDRPACAPGG
jgi:competence protein ComEC